MSYSVYLFCGHEYLYIVKVGKFFQKIVIKIAQKKKVDKEIKTYEAETFAALGTFNVTSKHQFIIVPQIMENTSINTVTNIPVGKKKGQDEDFPLDSF